MNILRFLELVEKDIKKIWTLEIKEMKFKNFRF